MRLIIITGIIVLFLLPTAGNAQKYDSGRFSFANFYLNGSVAIPSKDFRKAIQNNFGNMGFGGSLGLLISPLYTKKPSPVLVGIDFGYYLYGVDKQASTATSLPYKTTFQVLSINGIARLRPRFITGKVTPFVDGLLGMKQYVATTKIDKNLVNLVFNDDQPEVINEVVDKGLNYGLGVGFYTNGNNSESLGFTLRVLYMWGDEVEYVKRGSLKVNTNNLVTYETDRANTSVLTIQLGISGATLATWLNR